MIFSRGNKAAPTLSLVRAKDAGTAEFSAINALAATLTKRVRPLFTAALERIADSATPIGAGDKSESLRRENANLRAILAKTRAELACALQRERRSSFLAFHDDLTALPNRRFFLERLGSALKTRDSIPADVAVIYLDLMVLSH